MKGQRVDDWELLERYRSDGSQQAFAALVDRHVGLVFGVCRRRVRDAHLAEDVTQAVFTLLARRGPTSRVSTLAPWLIKTSRYACANAYRAGETRQRHERAAAAEHRTVESNAMSDDATPQSRASDVELLLDDAMQSAISDADRELLLLRYHHDQSVNEIGASFGIAPNTATKRLTRALDRLRKFMTQRGVDVSSAVVAEALVRVAHETAPFGLAMKSTAVATGGAACPLAVQQITRGVSHMIRATQLKIVASVMAVVLLGGGGAIAVARLFAQHSVVVSQKPPTTQPEKPMTPIKPIPPIRKLIANSPKEALTLFAKASRDVDIDGMKSLVRVADPKEESLMMAACDFAGANASFLAAVKDRFGDDAAKKLKSGMQTNLFESFIHSIETQLDQLHETIEGDTATLGVENDTDPVRLTRHEGSWKISATGMTKHWSDEQYTQVLGGMKRGTEVFAELAAAVSNGEMQSFDDLVKTLREQFPRR